MLLACNFSKKQFRFSEPFKSNFFVERPRATASIFHQVDNKYTFKFFSLTASLFLFSRNVSSVIADNLVSSFLLECSYLFVNNQLSFINLFVLRKSLNQRISNERFSFTLFTKDFIRCFILVMLDSHNYILWKVIRVTRKHSSFYALIYCYI